MGDAFLIKNKHICKLYQQLLNLKLVLHLQKFLCSTSASFMMDSFVIRTLIFQGSNNNSYCSCFLLMSKALESLKITIQQTEASKISMFSQCWSTV